MPTSHPRSRPSRPSRYVWSLGVFVAAVAVVAAVGLVFLRGVGPITGRQHCTASVGGHQVRDRKSVV